ncbi:hypothetical protein SeMB42_g02886 [Synchytrium endobioticum]|nr:hypothetical protein SeMB42_g02886 [Synchytrium endobioticum]
MHHSIWAFDGSGVKIWANVVTDGATPPPSWPAAAKWQEDFKMDLDFYPLTVMMHRSIIMGIEQRMSLKSSVQCTFYKLETMTHLYLHTIIRHILSRGMEEEAVAFAAGFRHLQYFGHSLEMLLHQVLEEEAETYAGFSKGALLPCIARFLEAFPHHLDVIVRCARKTEVALWEYFFSIVGDAKELFSQCLQSGTLDTATSYLIIIQTLEPASISSKLAVQLLERAFEMEDFETGKELVRFVTSINDGIHRQEQLHSPTTGNGIGTTKDGGTATDKTNVENHARASDGTDFFYVEVLISKHARTLMARQRVRALARFATQLSFPLIAWLKKERNRSAMVDDWHGALMSLHEQFERPLPHEVITPSAPRTPPSARKPSAANAMTNPAASAAPGPSSLPLSVAARLEPAGTLDGHSSRAPLRKRANTLPLIRPPDSGAVSDEAEEVQAMIRATREADCWDWCLMLASFAMDVPTLLAALSEDDGPAAGLRMKWRAALLSTNCRGYQQLVHVVESKLLDLSTRTHA